MILSFIFIAVLCLYKIRFALFEKPKLKFYDDYMSLKKTTSIKGVFILIVFFNHVSSYLSLSDSIFNSTFWFLNSTVISQSMVSMFLLYSGYAVMLSYIKKGRDYVKKMPVNRILKVLLHFDIAVLIYLILQTALGVKYSVLQIILSFIGWESLGNSNWYIFAIIVLYIFSYISFMLGKDNYKLCVIIQLSLTFAYVIVLSFFKESWWWNTVLVYPIGAIYCLYKDKIDTLFKRKTMVYYASLFISIGLTLVFIKFRYLPVADCARHIFFAIVVLLLTMKVQINNKILYFFGENLFSIYIMQRLPMILLDYLGISSKQAVFVILSFLVTVPLSVLFSYVVSRLDTSIFKNESLKKSK